MVPRQFIRHESCCCCCCRYKGDRHIMAVAAKLKKFHSVMQECGMRLGLQDVLVKPGQTLAQLMEQDAEQVKGLTAAAAAARSAAVAAIAGRAPAAAAVAAADDAAKTAGAAAAAAASGKTSAAASAEIQPDSPADAAGMCACSALAASCTLQVKLAGHVQ
jgi:peptidoglycan hydrolase CwlO-like protein